MKQLSPTSSLIHQGVEAFCILHAQALREKGILKHRVAEIMKAHAG